MRSANLHALSSFLISGGSILENQESGKEE